MEYYKSDMGKKIFVAYALLSLVFSGTKKHHN